MSDGSRELVSRRSRHAVRDFMSGTTLREIDELWQDELFAPVFEDPEPVGGQRVTHFQGYLDRVDWSNAAQVSRALRVFEHAMAWAFDASSEFRPPPDRIKRLQRLFAQDGYTWTDAGRLVGGPSPVVEEELLSALTDASVIVEHLERIARALQQQDPAQVIGSAKELIESTAKLVLNQRGQPVGAFDSLPDLVRRAQETLLIHPSQAASGPDGTRTVKRVLGAAATIATGIAELRNSGFGTGHGPAAPRWGLSDRHARLAINSARLWCEFVLDTLADERAPWRAAQMGDPVDEP